MTTTIPNTENIRLIKPARWFMILTGLQKGPVVKNPIINIIYWIYSKFTIGYFFIFVSSLYTELIRLILNNYDLNVISSSFSMCVVGTKLIIKLVIFFKNKFLDLFDEIIKKEGEIWQTNDEEVKKVYMNKAKLCKIFIIIQSISVSSTVVALCAGGINSFNQLSRYNRINNASLESHSWYQIWLPFNKLEHIPWTIIINLMCSFSGGSYTCIGHILFITLMMAAAVQLEVLQIKLKKFVQVKSFESVSEEDQAASIAVLKDLIKEHQRHILFIDRLNESTKGIVLMEFLLSSMDVASLSLMVLKFNTSEIFFNLLFIQLLIWQIFTLSWSCNEIMVQSLGIADSLQESEWYLLHNEGRQMVLIMMTRSQQPLEITIGPFGAMTLETGLMILKGAYSYISLMM